MLIIAFVILLITALVNSYWSVIVSARLKQIVLNSTDSLYTVTFSNARLQILQGKIIIENVDLKPDMAIYSKRKALKLAPNTLYTLHLNRLIINHIHPFKLYFESELNIEQIVLSQPDLYIDYEQNRDEDTVLRVKKTPYEHIEKILKSVRVQNIVLSDAKIHYKTQDHTKKLFSEFNNLSIIGTNFLLDSATQYDRHRFLFCEDVSAELKDINGITDDKRYNYRVNKLLFSTSASRLMATGLSYMPVKPLEVMFKGNNIDGYMLKLDSLTLNHFDIKAFSKYHKIIASSMVLKGGNAQLFTNPAPDDTTIDQSVNFPHIILRRLPFGLKIDSVHVDSSDVYFTDYNKFTAEPGTVSFQRINADFYNVTNNKQALKANNILGARVKAYFMNYGLINLNLSFNLTDEDASFSYAGTVGSFDLEKVNSLSIPLGLIKVTSGSLKSLKFDMHGNRAGAHGKLLVLYNNFRVSIYKHNTDSTINKMGIVSLLANQLLIKHDNPLPYQQARVVQINYKRHISNSAYNLMWKSIYSGLKTSVGFDAQTELMVKQKIAEFKIEKQNRAEKKMARKAARTERQQIREIKQEQKQADKYGVEAY